MALIKKVRGFEPQVGPDCWLAENATIVGEVVMGEGCTVWFGAVVRGDVNSITIGKNSNIQDNVTIHGTYEKASTTIGNSVSVGHNAVIHGCTIEDDVLIGIGAIVLDNAIVRSGAIVGAGAVVLANTEVEPNCVYGGIPARKLKEIDEDNRDMQSRIAGNYKMYAGWFRENE